MQIFIIDREAEKVMVNFDRTTPTTRLVMQSRRFFAILVEPLAKALEPHVGNVCARNVPNMISVLRAILGLVASWGIYHATTSLERWAYIVAILALILSDGIDGTLARRLEITSLFGATFDPLSDKLLIGGLMYGLSLKFDSPLFWRLMVVLWTVELGNIVAGGISGAMVSKLGTKEKAGASNIGKVKMGFECLIVFVGWALIPLSTADAMICGLLAVLAVPLAIGSFVGYLNKAVSAAIALASR